MLTLPFRNEKTNVNFVTSYKCNGFGNRNISRTILGRTLLGLRYRGIQIKYFHERDLHA